MSLNLAVKEDGPLVPCRPLKKKRILYLSTVASPSPWTRTGGACVHEGRERLFVSEALQTKHTKSRRKKENERHRPLWPMKPGVCSLLLQGGRRLVAVPASRAARGIGTGSSFSSRQPLPAPC